MASKFRTLAVTNVNRLTEDSVAISLLPPDDYSHEYEFQPGQYLTLRAIINGEELRRSYSICSTPQEGLRVGIKRIPDGKFSTFAQDLKVGDTIEALPPNGLFVCDAKHSASFNFLLVAAGSGITPVLSIASALLRNAPGSVVTLVYGNRTTSSIMFRTELEDLKDKFLERFHVYHVLSQETQDVELFSGRIDVSRVQKMVEKGIIDPKNAKGIYLCGPAAMTQGLTELFGSYGIKEDKLHRELFEAPDQPSPIVVSEDTRKVVEKGVGIEVLLDGITRQFQLTDVEDTVLKAAEKSGLELPFSCAGGMCATCRCKVVEGKAEMDRNFSLDKWEVDAGFVLACQSRPKSEKLILDFDAA